MKEKKICTKCGNEMNHHADKIIYSDSRTNQQLYDKELDGYLEKHFKCPNCGATVSEIKQQGK